MNTILRNFLTTLKRFKTASALNIVGLSVAFAAFIVIMTQVDYARSFDRFHPDAEQIYRVEISKNNTTYTPILSRPMIDLLAQAPQIRQSALLADLSKLGFSLYGPYLTVENNGSKTGYKEWTALVFPEFAEIFDFRMTEGNRDALREPNRVLIPQSMALRFFGGAPALNRRITFVNDTATMMTVGGVYEDFPDNTQIKNRIYIPMDRTRMLESDSWANSGYSFYVKLWTPEASTALKQEWMSRLRPILDENTWMHLDDIRLTALPDIYYATDTEFDLAEQGSRTTTAVLAAIGLLILVVAGINFVNFSTSLVPMRVKSINTQKVLGSPLSALRAALIGEAVGIALIAYILAVFWVYLLHYTSFDQLISGSISLEANLGIVTTTLGVAVAVGLAAGIYPAFYATSFPPALVLKKGSFGTSAKGRRLRTALIGFQYVVSIGLIIAALFMQMQNDFMRSMKTGLNTEHFALVQLSQDMARKAPVIRNRLMEKSSITDVSFGGSVVGSNDLYPLWGFGENAEGEPISLNVIFADWNLPKLLGAKIIEGRDFLESERNAEIRKLLINETACKRYGMRVGQRFEVNNTEIVGVVEDFNFASLRNTVQPMAFIVGDIGFPLDWVYVKTSGDPYDAAGAIRGALAGVDPTYPAEVQVYDTFFNKLYMQERRTTGLVTIFSLLAVVISLVGVFGLVLFETQYRRKEIGVRKVMGATVTEILNMFNRKFVWIVMVCFVIAAPFAWYGMHEWLTAFAYRTPIHGWVFVLSLAIVMLLTLITVSVQSLRAATANPVDSLKAE